MLNGVSAGRVTNALKGSIFNSPKSGEPDLCVTEVKIKKSKMKYWK